MSVPIAYVGRHGRLDLTFVLKNGQTALSDAYCEVPFKITRLQESRSFGLPHLILMHCTAGLFGGDELECTIRVQAGARLVITQQSSTKVHPSAAGPAVQHMSIYVAAGAELHLYCDPIIPFAGSCLRQFTSIEVDAGARLYLWESYTAGRVGRGEIWEFDEFSSETCLRLSGRRLYLDRFVLRPKQYRPTGEWEAADFRYFGTALHFGKDAEDFADRLHEVLTNVAVDTLDPDLTIARVLTIQGQTFHRIRQAFTSISLGHTLQARIP
jgi:urease accessory protein